MADELQVPRLRSVGPSQGQTPPLLYYTNSGAVAIGASGTAPVIAGYTVNFPTRGAIWVPDSMTGQLNNTAAGTASCGNIVEGFIQVIQTTPAPPANNNLRNWLATYNTLSLFPTSPAAIQAETFEEIDALEPVGGFGPLQSMNVFFIVVVNTTATGAGNYTLFTALKYHFKLQQQ